MAQWKKHLRNKTDKIGFYTTIGTMDHNEKFSQRPRSAWILLNIVQYVSMKHDSISSALLHDNILNYA